MEIFTRTRRFLKVLWLLLFVLPLISTVKAQGCLEDDCLHGFMLTEGIDLTDDERATAYIIYPTEDLSAQGSIDLKPGGFSVSFHQLLGDTLTVHLELVDTGECESEESTIGAAAAVSIETENGGGAPALYIGPGVTTDILVWCDAQLLWQVLVDIQSPILVVVTLIDIH